jgi:hypothetical protein
MFDDELLEGMDDGPTLLDMTYDAVVEKKEGMILWYRTLIDDDVKFMEIIDKAIKENPEIQFEIEEILLKDI